MQAHDVMTTNVITVEADTDIRETARLLVTHRISAVPVVDTSGHILGIVSEGDLMRRHESETAGQPSWWLSLFLGPEQQSRTYIKTKGQSAGDVMSRPVVTVEENAPLEQIATILEKKRIKRVPVVREGKLVGIVSRADLLHGLVARSAMRMPSTDDRAMRATVLRALADAGISCKALSVVVSGGAVHIWGAVSEDDEKAAPHDVAENAPSVGSVQLEVGAIATEAPAPTNSGGARRRPRGRR